VNLILTEKEKQVIKKSLKIFNVSLWVVIAISIPMLMGLLHDSEIQLAKSTTELDFVIDVSNDMCDGGSGVFCNYLASVKSELDFIKSYNFIFINYEEFKKEYQKTDEFKTFVKEYLTSQEKNDLLI